MDLVDSEAAAKSISEPVAQGLRLTFRNLAATPNADIHALLAGAQMPLEDEPIMKAAQSLDDAAAAARSQREALLRQVFPEVRKRSAELLRDAKSAVEIDAFLANLERVTNLAREHVDDPNAWSQFNELTNCASLMRSLRNVIAMPPASDPTRLAGALARFHASATAAPDCAPPYDVQKRISDILAPYKGAVEAAQKDLDAALIGQKPSAQITTALKAFEEASSGFSVAAIGANSGHREFEPRGPYSAINTYQALAQIAGLLELRHWSKARQSIANLRQSIRQLGSNRAAPFEELLAKWNRQVSEAADAALLHFQEQLRAKLNAVKQPADLDAVVAELEEQERAEKGEDEPKPPKGLSGELASFAAAWSAANSDRMFGRGMGENNPKAGGYGPEVNNLRQRIERDILSQSLQAPELIQPPLASQPLAAAISKFCDQLGAEGQWRRALQILEGLPERIKTANPRIVETIAPVRSYVAGQNFEHAEVWADAAKAYKSVLGAATDATLVKDATERLKALAKDHSEGFEGLKTSSRIDSPK